MMSTMDDTSTRSSYHTKSSLICIHLLMCLAIFLLLILLLLGSLTNAIPIDSQTTFGHSIKNGPLPAKEEVTAFEHQCQIPPCVITLIHVPSIYPPQNEQWNWTHGIINFYIDHNTDAIDYYQRKDVDDNESDPKATVSQPNISISLLELAGESTFNQPNANPVIDGTPWGIDMMGRTAITGGVYSTVRIPFQTFIKITIQAPSSAIGQSTYWMIVRGLEGHGITLGGGDVQLPSTARLRVIRIPPTQLANYEFITLASSPKSMSGAILRITLDTIGPDLSYLEGCLRLITTTTNKHRDNEDDKDGGGDHHDTSELIYLSSGVEDYFLSASYFDAGMFKTPNSGLTYLDRANGAIGAYKTHTYDPIIYQNGMNLIFRNNEITDDCGTIDCCPRYFRSKRKASFSSTQEEDEETFAHGNHDAGSVLKTVTIDASEKKLQRKENSEDTLMGKRDTKDGKQVTYSGLVWFYEWETPDRSSNGPQRLEKIASYISTIADLSSSGLISNEEEDSAVDLLLENDSNLALILEGLNATHQRNQLARQVHRYLQKQAFK